MDIDELSIKINTEEIKIEERIFLTLLQSSHIQNLLIFKDAINKKRISFNDLKNLALKADIPYPLFFAPYDKIKNQIRDKDKCIFEKFPGKLDSSLNSRGILNIKDIELIIKDLARKQEFLKRRVLLNAPDSLFMGIIAKKVKESYPNKQLAEIIQKELNLDLNYLRKLSKDNVSDYLVDKAESKGILVSFSSYNFMPQRINPELGFSGLCIKDKKFPFIFINNKDGDDNPKILESSGRQIFTLVAMLVCIAMNKFYFSSKKDKMSESCYKKIFTIAGMILIPDKDLENIKIKTLDDLKDKARFYKVTPSMLLFRLTEMGLISKNISLIYKEKLKIELKKAEPNRGFSPSPVNGFAKYNGKRFSKEVVYAQKIGLISKDDVKNILFRKGRMQMDLFESYVKKFS